MKQAANYVVTAFTYDRKARTFTYLELNNEPVSLHITDSYEDLQNLPMINGVTLIGDKSTADLGIVIPTKLSQLENDPAFITAATQSLANYYLKTQTYDKSEVDSMIGALNQLKFEIVEALPVSDISPTTIYLVPDDDPTTNVYFQYLYVNDDWALLGSTEVDLSNYYTKTEVDTLLADKLDSALETPVVVEGTSCSTVLEFINAINSVKQSKTLSTSISYHGTTFTNLELFLQALASRTQLTNEDLDTVTTPGSYYATGTDSVTHKPTGISNFELTVSNLDSTKVFQLIKCYSDDTIYYRVFMSSTWSAWHHLEKDLVIDSSIDITSTNPVQNQAVATALLTKLQQVTSFPSDPSEGDVVLYLGSDSGYVLGAIYQYQEILPATTPKTYHWVSLSSAAPNASQVSYDPTSSGLSATNVQSAIDEIVPELVPSGGTTGQVLIKASGTDHDLTWKDTTDRVAPNNRGLVESQSVYSAINSALSSIYTPRGDLTCAELTSDLLIAANVGNVYEMSDAGTTSVLFINGAGHPITIGDNVGIINAGEGRILYNLMANAFDLTDYQKKDLAQAVEGATTVEGALAALSTNKQPKTLSTPITVGGQSQTTVEGALGGLNGLVPSNASTSNKLVATSDTFITYTPNTDDYSTWAEFLEMLRQKGTGLWCGKAYLDAQWWYYTASIQVGAQGYWLGSGTFKSADNGQLKGVNKAYSIGTTWDIVTYAPKSGLLLTADGNDSTSVGSNVRSRWTIIDNGSIAICVGYNTEAFTVSTPNTMFSMQLPAGYTYSNVISANVFINGDVSWVTGTSHSSGNGAGTYITKTGSVAVESFRQIVLAIK